MNGLSCRDVYAYVICVIVCLVGTDKGPRTSGERCIAGYGIALLDCRPP